MVRLLARALASLVVLWPIAAAAAGYTATVTRVGTLTGPRAPVDMKVPDICGTDLGTMAEMDGTTVFAFGDTFGWTRGGCPNFGPNWRSNALAFTTDTDPSDGIAIERWYTKGGTEAVAVAEGGHAPAFSGEQSRIPTSLLWADGKLYLHTMSVHGFAKMGGVWLCNSSRFYVSADHGATWAAAPSDFGDFRSSFNMLALSAAQGSANADGHYVYAIGTPCGRFAGARAARVPVASILDNAMWEYFDGTGWSSDRASAAEVIKPGVGEGSLAWNPGLKKWMFTTLNELSQTIELRLSDLPQGPWSDPIALAAISDYPQAYGGFMNQAWISADGLTFYFVMSQFGPYNTYVMRANLAPRG